MRRFVACKPTLGRSDRVKRDEFIRDTGATLDSAQRSRDIGASEVASCGGLPVLYDLATGRPVCAMEVRRRVTRLQLRGIGRRARWLVSAPGMLLLVVTRALVAQCPVDTGPARPFGPHITAADSGRIYASAISPDGREYYDFRRIGDAAEIYRIFRS